MARHEHQPETEDDRAKRLLRIGFDVATRVREEDVNDVVREFKGLDYGELRDLALLLAACVDVERTVSELVWWTDLDRVPPTPRRLTPCGTHSAYNRHKERNEAIDLACEMANRRYERERVRERKRPSRRLKAAA